jgi:hypothetical protein
MTVAVIASGYDADNASIVVGSSNIIQLNLNNANVWTAQQTFTIGHLALKGTSTAPVNGASPTGTTWGAVGSIVVQSPTAGVDGTGWNVKKRITGLTVGTAYWFDIELATANASDSASVTNVTCVITEVG